ncbi:MAG: outer membrane protein assembly factor BamD [Chthoniobacterales bacterium]|nr:outer membrane protein assembly factor BamD [Chthoniobacterales bacterium]
MVSRFNPLVPLLICCLACPFGASAAVVFKPNEKTKYVAPGEEEVSGNAQQLFQTAQAAENSGNIGRAIKAYRQLVRRYPKDTLAAGSAYRFAQLQERSGDLIKAAGAYRVVVENYPRSPHFDESIEAQFRIGEQYLNGKKLKLLGLPLRSAVDKSVEIFAAIIRTAPYGKYTARAQFNIGLANEKQGNYEGAVKAYQAVSEKFPEHPVAADAQYQIGYLWLNAARTGTRDAKAAENAKIGFQDFLFRYPKSEKVPQARENLRALEQKQTTNSFQIARYYDKQKNYRAAVIYYFDVIRQQPGSPQSEQAKRRVEELRPRVGDEVVKAAAAVPKKRAATTTAAATREGGRSTNVPMRLSPSDVNALPPPEYDESLPPPASLMPDSTFAPDVGDWSSSEPASGPTPTPTPSPSGQ